MGTGRSIMCVVGMIVLLCGVGAIGDMFRPRFPEPAKWQRDPRLSEAANNDMTALMSTDARQYHWTDQDWAAITRMAKSGDTITVRAQAIYQMGDQAGCNGCLAKIHRENIASVLANAVDDPSENIRAAALKTLYSCRFDNVPDKSNDPSELVRYTWKMTYGRKP